MYNFHIPPQHIGFLRFQSSIARMLSVVEKRRQKNKQKAHLFKKSVITKNIENFRKVAKYFSFQNVLEVKLADSMRNVI